MVQTPVVVYAGIGELKKLNTVGAVKVVGDGFIYATDVDLRTRRYI